MQYSFYIFNWSLVPLHLALSSSAHIKGYHFCHMSVYCRNRYSTSIAFPTNPNNLPCSPFRRCLSSAIMFLKNSTALGFAIHSDAVLQHLTSCRFVKLFICNVRQIFTCRRADLQLTLLLSVWPCFGWIPCLTLSKFLVLHVLGRFTDSSVLNKHSTYFLWSL